MPASIEWGPSVTKNNMQVVKQQWESKLSKRNDSQPYDVAERMADGGPIRAKGSVGRRAARTKINPSAYVRVRRSNACIYLRLFPD
jgi:hypothetical protein